MCTFMLRYESCISIQEQHNFLHITSTVETQLLQSVIFVTADLHKSRCHLVFVLNKVTLSRQARCDLFVRNVSSQDDEAFAHQSHVQK